jgi:hypothetical protein
MEAAHNLLLKRSPQGFHQIARLTSRIILLAAAKEWPESPVMGKLVPMGKHIIIPNMMP